MIFFFVSHNFIIFSGVIASIKRLSSTKYGCLVLLFFVILNCLQIRHYKKNAQGRQRFVLHFKRMNDITKIRLQILSCLELVSLFSIL